MSIVVTSLSEALNNYPETKELVYAKDSAMCNIIDDESYFKKLRKNITVFLKIINSKVVGWAWVIPYNKIVNNRRKQAYMFMVMVKPYLRKNGIGNELFKNAFNLVKSRRRKILVFPWDKRSYNFYKKMNVSEKNYRTWLSCYYNIMYKHTEI